MRAADQCCQEKVQALSAISSCTSEKLNFEKRVEDIKQIIAILEGSMGGGLIASMLGANIPEVISKFNSSAQEADTSYRESMKCSDVPAASIMETFRSKTVEEDPNLSDALQKFKNEVARLEQAIRDIEAQLNSLSALVSSLSSKINAYNAESDSLRHVMNSCAYEMNHFRSYM
ncbi:MAG: hypothetical protein K5695_09605 [Oscillospiraceae bacterium]|nr:hypothetical protein [Oscillospiraceae bacterium]